MTDENGETWSQVLSQLRRRKEVMTAVQNKYYSEHHRALEEGAAKEHLEEHRALEEMAAKEHLEEHRALEEMAAKEHLEERNVDNKF